MTHGNVCITASPRHPSVPTVHRYPITVFEHATAIGLPFSHFYYFKIIGVIPHHFYKYLPFLRTYIPNTKTWFQIPQEVSADNLFLLDGSYRFKQGVIEKTETSNTSLGQESGIHTWADLSIACPRAHIPCQNKLPLLYYF
jgi:hypothetical protein